MVGTAFFGEVPGNPVGTMYKDRKKASRAGVHRPTVGGICGTAARGAESISVNGGYVDDVDLGLEIVYTGHGGNDPSTKMQIANQSFDSPGNGGLVTSERDRLPVRVLRGYKGDANFSPRTGYRYDGLYEVIEHWSETGKDGFLICRFRLRQLVVQQPGRAAF